MRWIERDRCSFVAGDIASNRIVQVRLNQWASRNGVETNTEPTIP